MDDGDCVTPIPNTDVRGDSDCQALPVTCPVPFAIINLHGFEVRVQRGEVFEFVQCGEEAGKSQGGVWGQKKAAAESTCALFPCLFDEQHGPLQLTRRIAALMGPPTSTIPFRLKTNPCC
jgi:hypothetical protein